MSITYPSLVSTTFPNSSLVWSNLTSRISPIPKFAGVATMNFAGIGDGNSSNDIYTVDIGTATQLAQLGSYAVQTLYVDASCCLIAPVIITTGAGQKIRIAPGTQGYYPIINSPSNTGFTFQYPARFIEFFQINNSSICPYEWQSTPANSTLKVYFLNVPFTHSVWQVSKQELLTCYVGLGSSAFASSPQYVTLCSVPFSCSMQNFACNVSGASYGSSACNLNMLLYAYTTLVTPPPSPTVITQGSWNIPSTAYGGKGDSFLPMSLAGPFKPASFGGGLTNGTDFFNLSMWIIFSASSITGSAQISWQLAIDDVYTSQNFQV